MVKSTKFGVYNPNCIKINILIVAVEKSNNTLYKLKMFKHRVSCLIENNDFNVYYLISMTTKIKIVKRVKINNFILNIDILNTLRVSDLISMEKNTNLCVYYRFP